MTELRPKLPTTLNVLVLADLSDEEIARVSSLCPGRLQVERGKSGESELASQLGAAHVLYLASSSPRDLRLRAPALLWAHFAFAGVSNLRGGSWWEAPVMITSSRGLNHPRPLAESVIAATFMFARGIDVAVRKTGAQDFSSTGYGGLKLVQGKTMGIVGLGGIGALVAQIARGCGMRVLATRRSASERRVDVDGVDVLYPPSQLATMLGESDFVAVCAMSTPETTSLIDGAAFEAMKPGAYIINVARGEIIDEPALIAALESGKVAGAFLDVWGESIAAPPSPQLRAAPNVVLTPHTSNGADSPQSFSLDLFYENLAHLLAGEPLRNVIDWTRGY